MKKTKKIASEIIQEYGELISRRTQINHDIAERKDKLGLNPRKTTSLDEMCQELDRLEELNQRFTELLNRGNTDITTLSEEELLTFNRLKDITNLTENTNELTVQILAIRQGLMNIADKDNSILEGSLNEMYINSEEFVEHATISRIVDFINAYNNTSFNVEKIPQMSEDEVRALVVRQENSELSTSLHPRLQLFLGTLKGINERTGYAQGISEPVPFRFAEGELKGEILISQPEKSRKVLSVGEIAVADKELSLTDGEVKGIPGFLMKTFPSLTNIITKIFNKGNGER